MLKRIKWELRFLAYWILGIPGELEESIRGLNWAIEQNAYRIRLIEELLNSQLEKNENP